MRIDLRRDSEDTLLCTKEKEFKFLQVKKPVEQKEAQWIIKMLLGLKPVKIYKFHINKMDMLHPWSAASLNVPSLEK